MIPVGAQIPGRERVPGRAREWIRALIPAQPTVLAARIPEPVPEPVLRCGGIPAPFRAPLRQRCRVSLGSSGVGRFLAGWLDAWVARCLSAVLAALALAFPGKAWAATSVSTPVSATLPAISQRLMRASLRRAASRVWVVWWRIRISVVVVKQPG